MDPCRVPSVEPLLCTCLDTQMCSAPATLTLGIDAKLEKDRVPCFQAHHWVRDEGQGLAVFGGTPLGSAPFLQQLL